MSIKFGTSGWRGIIALDFTFENVRKVVAAIAEMLLEKGASPRVAIGFDPRFLSPEFAQEASRVLAAKGVSSVLTPNPTPTPVLSWLCRQDKLSGIINFTASHNPALYNGIKFSGPDGAPAVPEVTKRIEQLIQTAGHVTPIDFEKAKAEGLIRIFDPKEAYLKDLRKMLLTEMMAPFKVAIDPLYGASIGYPEAILNGLGFETTTLHSRRDPLFGGQRPEPEGSSIMELRDLVVKDGYKLGIACDGDADRFGVIDSDGSFITPNELIALLVRHLSRTRGWRGVVVRTNATTLLIDRVAKIEGLEVLEVPVGFKYIGAIMERQEITIGGEESGGLSVRGWVPEKDGILAVLLAAEMVAYWGKTLGQLLSEIHYEVGTVFSTRVDLRVPNETKAKLIEHWTKYNKETLAGFKVVSKDTFDGPRVVMENGAWLLIRPSGTEPVVRCYLEAPTKEGLLGIDEALRASI